jgi:hypothetical protein
LNAPSSISGIFAINASTKILADNNKSAVGINLAEGTQTASKSQGQDRAFDKNLIIPMKMQTEISLSGEE